ncbi:MAG: sfsA [Fibrobacteres bacterium]|nr:sfsA [Fibrobacterota bacterium]
MKFTHPLLPGTLLRRYKRFLADVRLDSGGELTVHCANPGAMLGCAEPGWRVMVSDSLNPARRLRHTLELVHNGAGWIGVNPVLANAVAEEGIRAGMVPELAGYDRMDREVRHGESTRFDFLLSRGGERCFVEVKSVTLVGTDGLSAFPDAVTSRGVKHIRELLSARAAGDRAVLLFVVQRRDGLKGFRAAGEIDPLYAQTLRDANAQGLEVHAHWAETGLDGIDLTSLKLPLCL